MPASSKTTWAQLKVGLMAIAALVILGFLIFLMAGQQGLFQSTSKIYTFLGDAAALTEGSPVTLNGVPIGGKVTKIELSGSTDPNRIVRVTMEIGSKYLSAIPVDSQIDLAKQNLLGTPNINIRRGKSAQTIQPGAELNSTPSTEIEDLFRQGSETLTTLQDLVKQAGDIIDDIQNGKGTIGKLLVDPTLVNNFIDIENQVKQLSNDLHNTITSTDNSVGKLLNDNGALYNEFHDIVAHSTKLVDDIDNGKGSLGQFIQNPAVHDQTLQMLNDIHQLLAGINAGEGSLGKIVKSTELTDEVKTTLGRVDSLLDKMQNGDGTVARLLNDPSLFQDLDSLTRESNGLIKDFRSNPKKFLHIKLSIF